MSITDDDVTTEPPVVDDVYGWLDECASKQLDEVVARYDENADPPLRGESITVSIEGIAEDIDRELAQMLITENASIEASVKRAVQMQLEERVDGRVDLADAGWCIEWTDPIDEMIVDVSEPLSRRTGEMVAVRGRIRHRTDPIPRFTELEFVCRECMAHLDGFRKFAVDVVRGKDVAPSQCISEPCTASGADSFDLDDSKSEKRDYQFVTVEQSPGVDGSTPSKIPCWLFGEGRLTSAAEGERVTVVGRLRLNPDAEPVEHYIDTHSVITDREDSTVEVTDEDRERVHEIVEETDGVLETATGSFAANVHGHTLAKKGLVLTGVGAGREEKDEQTHVMLIGDPGTAKTQLTSALREVIPSTRKASLTQSSSVGLTASAVKETVGGREEWVIRAGALSLASGGILTVDELDEADFDLSKLNDALSEGEIPVDKAGESTTIRTDTRVVATANPAGAEFDPREPLDEQIQFTADVVSRFDLAFPFQDDAGDEEMNEGIMHATAADYLGEDEMTEEYAQYAPDLSTEEMRTWFAVAQEQDPAMTAEAMDQINESWMLLRDTSDGGAISINPRRLRSVIRLAFAHARLRLGDKVTVEDAKKAFSVVSAMLGEWGYDLEGDSSSSKSTSSNATELGDDYETGELNEALALKVEKKAKENPLPADELRKALNIDEKHADEVASIVEEAREDDSSDDDTDDDGVGAVLAHTGGDEE